MRILLSACAVLQTCLLMRLMSTMKVLLLFILCFLLHVTVNLAGGDTTRWILSLRFLFAATYLQCAFFYPFLSFLLLTCNISLKEIHCVFLAISHSSKYLLKFLSYLDHTSLDYCVCAQRRLPLYA